MIATSANALTVGLDGTITNWGVKPFTSGVNNASTANLVGSIYRTLANNYAPLAYPGEPPFTPSGGEPFDLEEMYARFVGNHLQVLVVSSADYSMAAFGYPTIKRGDLFVTLDFTTTIGVVTQSQYAPGVLPAGNMYTILNPSDVNLLQNLGNSLSYLNINTIVPNDYGPNDVIRNITGPWAVASTIPNGQLLTNTAGIQTASFNYGGTENATSIFEYDIDLTGFIPPLPSFLGLHQTWGCGNDVIQLNVPVTPEFIPPVPSPAAATFGGAMMGLLALTFRRPRDDR